VTKTCLKKANTHYISTPSKLIITNKKISTNKEKQMDSNNKKYIGQVKSNLYCRKYQRNKKENFAHVICILSQGISNQRVSSQRISRRNKMPTPMLIN
jgi:hypothetical protein